MTRVSIIDLGSIGILKSTDISPHLLPLEAWSDGKNIRFSDNKVKKFKGHQEVFATPSIAPHYALQAITPDGIFWLYAGAAKVYAVSGGTHADITRAVGGDYTVDLDWLWNGGVLGGIPIINNGADEPQYWATVGLGQRLQDLTNWTAGMTARVVRPFKEYLIALRVTRGGTEYPQMVKWSHPAEPGALPTSWDHTDATKDAGEFELSDTQTGMIQDGLALGDIFVIYKSGATHGLQWVGGTYIFRRFDMFQTSGILSTDCVALLPGGKHHFVATGDDLIIHDGVNVQSLVDRKWKKFIAQNIDTTNYKRSFCVTNFKEKELWFCFPSVGATLPNLAVVWSAVDKSLGVRELSGISSMANGVIDESAPDATWDADSGTWNSDGSVWNFQDFPLFVRGLLACDPGNTKLYEMDATDQLAGSNMDCFVERKGLTISGLNRYGKPTFNFERRKLVTRLWPKVIGGPVNIRIGAVDNSEDAIAYSAAISFDPTTDEYVDPDPPPNGRFIAVRFESIGDVAWELERYDINVEDLGEF